MTPARWRSAAVMTFGGAKGTITLSLMFTIPFTVTWGVPFPMRDEFDFHRIRRHRRHATIGEFHAAAARSEP